MIFQQKPYINDLGRDIYQIDLLDNGERGRTGCYVIKGEKIALVDVGSSPSRQQILAGIAELGMTPDQIDYVIVTHIHLDHAGGLGYLMPLLPNATAVCHPRAARHMIDPSRLIAGAKAVYGDDFDNLFGQIVPVPEERLLIRDEGDQLDLGGGHLLTFYDTPGHARHHFSIHDAGSRGIFTGDTVGVRYVPELTGWDFIPIFPSTSPTEFDRNAVFASIDKLQQVDVDRIYHAHFGMTEPASAAFERTLKTADDYDRMSRELFRPGLPWEELAEKIRDYIRADLKAQGLAGDDLDLSGMELDIRLNAQGMLFVLEKEHRKKQEAEQEGK
ncbi:MAG TPA: MBL fold metallo-hydrolase, partial [Bacilli bacterium]|nr:MBL fold metallo-hydrolase [Bacilli bacterium]